MLKILQARLQQYVNCELPDVPACFRKGWGTRDQIANIHWIMEKAREFQKSIYFCFIDYVKAFDCVDHSKLWKILKEMGIPDHLICLLRNLYAGQEATVKTGHGTTAAAAAAKSLQSCLTLCDPIDGSPPGSPVHGIFQARVLELGAIAFSGPQVCFLLIFGCTGCLLLCAGFLVAASGLYSLDAVLGLLIVVTFLVVGRGL